MVIKTRYLASKASKEHIGSKKKKWISIYDLDIVFNIKEIKLVELDC